jgi:hypothetical protein
MNGIIIIQIVVIVFFHNLLAIKYKKILFIILNANKGIIIIANITIINEAIINTTRISFWLLNNIVRNINAINKILINIII